jgi:hypothetical protein
MPDGEAFRELGHVEVDDAPAMVNEHDENEEDAQTRGQRSLVQIQPPQP